MVNRKPFPLPIGTKITYLYSQKMFETHRVKDKLAIWLLRKKQLWGMNIIRSNEKLKCNWNIKRVLKGKGFLVELMSLCIAKLDDSFI